MLRTATAVVLLASVAPAPEDPLGRVEQESQVRRRASFEIEATSRVLEQFVGDESQQADGELEYGLEIEASWVDHYASVAEGRPTAIERTFESAERVELNRLGEREDETEATSPLVDRTVRFERDEDGEWTARTVDERDELESEILDGLDHDVDFSFLLPEALLQAGESFEVDVAELRRLMRPSGELAFASDTPEAVRELVDESTESMWEDVDGELVVEYAGDDEGRDRYVIAVEAEGSGEAEIDLEDPDQEGVSFLETAIELDLEGVLLWDRANGHALDFTLSGEIVLIRRQGLRLAGPEGEVELGQRAELEGQIEIQVTSEPIADGQ